MIRIIVTLTALLVSMIIFSQREGKPAQGEFNGKLCNIGRSLCSVTPPNENNKSKL